MSLTKERFKQYRVWDRSVRIFHWVNVFCVMALMGLGIVLLNNKSLGISTDGKIALKTIHAYIGYVFVFNLIWRIIWGFLGSKYSKWRSILPFGKQYRKQLKDFVAAEKKNKPAKFLGHNPVARLMVTLLFLLLAVQALTGLVVAGTDLYLPPFGHEIAEWVTNAGEDHSQVIDLKPYSMVNVDPENYKAMKEFRKPFISMHVYVFYTLLAAILLHVGGVAFTEIREKSGLVSAMFTGVKVFSEKPVDLVESPVMNESASLGNRSSNKAPLEFEAKV